MKSCNADMEVIFIYDEGDHDPCHAVVKDTNGPWSNNRIGFCGCEPCLGPVPWCINPDGGLCKVCALSVEQRSDGKWYVKDEVPDTLYRYYRKEPRYCNYWEDD